jgi:hypothetical protein
MNSLPALNLRYLVTIHTVSSHLTPNSWYGDEYCLCLLWTMLQMLTNTKRNNMSCSNIFSCHLAMVNSNLLSSRPKASTIWTTDEKRVLYVLQMQISMESDYFISLKDFLFLPSDGWIETLYLPNQRQVLYELHYRCWQTWKMSSLSFSEIFSFYLAMAEFKS